MDNWKNQKCLGSVTCMPIEEVRTGLREVNGWNLNEDCKTILSSWKMRDFSAAIKFLNTVAELAEIEDHHPDFSLRNYRNITIELSTHSVGGISVNDLILAAKINELPNDLF